MKQVISAPATERVFSRKCIKCRQRAKALTAIPYETEISHDGRTYHINIPALDVPKCANCGEITFDEEANRVIDEAFRRVANLLTPRQIRSGREYLDYSQQEFADILGVAASTISRWETGAQVQQRSLNRFMRAFFQLEEFRSLLMQFQSEEIGSVETGQNASDERLISDTIESKEISIRGGLATETHVKAIDVEPVTAA